MFVKDFPGKFPLKRLMELMFGLVKCILFGGLTAKCVVEVSDCLCCLCCLH